MKKACWFIAIVGAVCVLILSLSGCAAMNWAFGPTQQDLAAADVDGDGVVTPEELKAAGLYVDASTWIDLGLQILGYLLPGAAAAGIAYKKVKEHRASLEAVVVGVENFKSKVTGTGDADAVKGLLLSELTAARDAIAKNPEALAAFVKSVTEKKAGV